MNTQPTIPTAAQLAALVAGRILPKPTAADIARATAFVDGDYRQTCDPDWFAERRDKAIRQVAMLECAKRQDAEHRAAVSQSSQRKVAA